MSAGKEPKFGDPSRITNVRIVQRNDPSEDFWEHLKSQYKTMPQKVTPPQPSSRIHLKRKNNLDRKIRTPLTIKNISEMGSTSTASTTASSKITCSRIVRSAPQLKNTEATRLFGELYDLFQNYSFPVIYDAENKAAASFVRPPGSKKQSKQERKAQKQLQKHQQQQQKQPQTAIQPSERKEKKKAWLELKKEEKDLIKTALVDETVADEEEEKEVKDPILPISGKRNILITSALPYVNNVPHLGNIIGCVLSADVFARFCRLRGYNAIYICGTDEYGTATETKAIQENTTPEAICAKYHKIHKKIYKWFNISFDKFGRTTTQQQTEIAQDIFNKNDKNTNVTSEDVLQQWCEHCQRFLSDRFVEGGCPTQGCEYKDARGDQCDSCGKLLNPIDLINPRCKLCGQRPIPKTSNHLFLDLPKLEPRLREWMQESSVKGRWSQNSINVSEGWLQTGLKTRCISRDLKWGTPVPKPGYQDKVFYVWFDAPIGYISITANYTKDWKKWWLNPKNVQLYQFMGKDNIPFHTVIFPSSLLGTGDPYTLLHHINTTEYLNYENGKFSKSRGSGVFGDDAMAIGIPSDVWRYYLLSARPETADAQFLWTDFATRNNADLLGKLGNFVNRALVFVSSSFDGKVPNRTPKLEAVDEKLLKDVHLKIVNFLELLEEVKIRDALKVAMNVAEDGNKYLQDTKPWDLIKEGKKDQGANIIFIAVNLVYALAAIFEPYTPTVSKVICGQLNKPLEKAPLANWTAESLLSFIPGGHRIGTPVPLFRRIEKDEVERFRERYRGKQAADFPISLKVGEVESVEEQGGELFILQINVGEEKNRQVVARLKKYKKEQLPGKTVVVLCNVRPTTFHQAQSEGVVLIAVEGKGTKEVIGLLTVDAPPGTQVIPDGGKLIERKNYDYKKEFSKLDLSANENGLVSFQGLQLKAGAALVRAEKITKKAKIQ